MSFPRQVVLLYRRILELHRFLPGNMREVGSAYVKEEFRLHKNADLFTRNRFLLEWEQYVMTLRKQIAMGNQLGADVDGSSLSQDQHAQLLELQEEIERQNRAPKR